MAIKKTVRSFIKLLARVNALAFPGEILEVRLIIGDLKKEPVSCSETREIRIRERLFVKYVSRLRWIYKMSQKMVLIRIAIHEVRHKLQYSGTRTWTKSNIVHIRSLVGEEALFLLQKFVFTQEANPKEIDAWVIEALCMRLIVRGRPLRDIKEILLSQPEA